MATKTTKGVPMATRHESQHSGTEERKEKTTQVKSTKIMKGEGFHK
jgi:hypothetical protein